MPGHSQKLRALTYKELETVGAFEILLGSPTIGGWGQLGQGVGVGGKKEANKPPSRPKYTKKAPKNRWFPTLIDLQIAKNYIFIS
jgi:hypothetical protein